MRKTKSMIKELSNEWFSVLLSSYQSRKNKRNLKDAFKMVAKNAVKEYKAKNK